MIQTNKGVFNNIAWKFLERVSAQCVTLIVSIILARLLEPSHYGMISIVTIFITIANVFVSDGFGSALIQKKNVDSLDFFSVLYFNILFSVFLYIVLFVCAPYIAAFFGCGYDILSPVLRVLGIRIILCAINSVQQAYVAKKMMFKTFFWSTSFGTVISAIIGIAMAYNGYGVWSLVAQYLANTIVDTIVINRIMKFHLKPLFSFKRLKELLSYGGNILGTKLLIVGYQELKALLIGKIYSSADLAFYDKGRQFPNLIVTNIDSSVGAVLFPKMSMEQDNSVQIKKLTRMSIRFSAFLMCPLMLGLASVAEPFIRLVLTEKWISCVPLLQIFCIVYLFQPIHTANMQAIKAIGRSDIFLKLEIIKKSIEIICLIAVVRISVNAIVVTMAILTILFTFINSIPNSKLLNYSFKEQMLDICPSIIMSLIMATIVCIVGEFSMPLIWQLIVQGVVGIIVYITIAFVSKKEELFYLINKVKNSKTI